MIPEHTIASLIVTSQLVSNYDVFDPRAFLNYYKGVNVWHHYSLCVLYKFYKSYGLPPVCLKIIEFSTGSVISYEISASLYTSEIVLSEYTEKNREVL